jgi:hypothetical protein
MFEECVSLFEAVEDRRGLSHALDDLGGVLTVQGDYGRAEALYDKSLRLAEEAGDNHAIASTLRSLGAVAYERAQGLYEDSAAPLR